ncbi:MULTISPECIES: hypothetical protein [Sphingomonas]|uniref:hypothetical protein n=1 Tax=Sphingomonas TaxID=13687 RepID=UPI000DEF7C2F|nr:MULTISPECIES: hypothetical protein [Sphingomonas]
MPKDSLVSTEPASPPVAASESLTDKAERCRRLAANISDRQAADVLRNMALQYEADVAHADR